VLNRLYNVRAAPKVSEVVLPSEQGFSREDSLIQRLGRDDESILADLRPFFSEPSAAFVNVPLLVIIAELAPTNIYAVTVRALKAEHTFIVDKDSLRRWQILRAVFVLVRSIVLVEHSL
jgi:hypothetical protein